MGDPPRSSGRTPVPGTHAQANLLDPIDRRLFKEDHDMLSSPFTVDVIAASTKMKSNSSPGMDVLTAEFYQVAPVIFGECLCIVFDHHLQSSLQDTSVRLSRELNLAKSAISTISQSQRQSAIALLYKIGERTCPGNYRPIALICVDLKVLFKTLTFRLQLALSKFTTMHSARGGQFITTFVSFLTCKIW